MYLKCLFSRSVRSRELSSSAERPCPSSVWSLFLFQIPSSRRRANAATPACAATTRIVIFAGMYLKNIGQLHLEEFIFRFNILRRIMCLKCLRTNNVCDCKRSSDHYVGSDLIEINTTSSFSSISYFTFFVYPTTLLPTQEYTMTRIAVVWFLISEIISSRC